jgi:[ribosomal protein S5]-alanine N-acetyltransferase
MGLLQNFLTQKPEYECRGQRTLMRAPSVDDFSQWRDIRQSSRDFLAPWEPQWRDDELLQSSFRKRVAHYAKLAHDDQAYAFFIFDVTGTTLLGGMTISNLRRGVAQMATLGYWIGASSAHQGYMTDALAATTRYACDELELHRLEAACLPSNKPSVQLLRRAGFAQEGFAKSYLKINNHWEDHILWGLLLHNAMQL